MRTPRQASTSQTSTSQAGTSQAGTSQAGTSHGADREAGAVVGEWLLHLQHARGASAHTLAAYERDLRKFLGD